MKKRRTEVINFTKDQMMTIKSTPMVLPLYKTTEEILNHKTPTALYNPTTKEFEDFYEGAPDRFVNVYDN